MEVEVPSPRRMTQGLRTPLEESATDARVTGSKKASWRVPGGGVTVTRVLSEASGMPSHPYSNRTGTLPCRQRCLEPSCNSVKRAIVLRNTTDPGPKCNSTVNLERVGRALTSWHQPSQRRCRRTRWFRLAPDLMRLSRIGGCSLQTFLAIRFLRIVHSCAEVFVTPRNWRPPSARGKPFS